MAGPGSNSSPRRLGTGMIAAAWLLVLGLLTAWFSGWLERQRNPNTEVAGVVLADDARQVVLRQNRRGHYVANGRINGSQQPITFILDTGATTVSIPTGVARALNLPRGRAALAYTANGTVTTYATRLDSVELGNIVLHNVRAHINPGMEGDEVLLGMSFLRQLDFSQRGEILTLRQRAADRP